MAAATMVLGCIVNIVFDYVFIFTFNLGIKGAAIATVLAQIISTVVMVYYYTKGSSNLKLKIKNFKFIKVGDGQIVISQLPKDGEYIKEGSEVVLFTL